MMATGGSTSTNPKHKLNLENIRDGNIKIKNLKLAELNDLCTTFYVLIEDLKVRLEKAKHPPTPPKRPTSSGPSSRT
jgi:hypothetical protein